MRVLLENQHILSGLSQSERDIGVGQGASERGRGGAFPEESEEGLSFVHNSSKKKKKGARY